MKKKNSIIRPVGSGIAMAVPLILGIFLNDVRICSVGAMGAFSYLAFQYISISYNLKAILLHGCALYLAFNFGAVTAMFPWVLPFVIGLLSCSAFVITKLFHIPKPDYFFVIMLFATGYNFRASSFSSIWHHSSYLVYGIVGSLFAGLLVSLIQKLPVTVPKNQHQKLSLKDKYFVMLYSDPEVLLKAVNFSMILFVSGYITYLQKDSYGSWILISSAAILAGEHLNHIKKRTVGRVLGGIVGILLGLLLISLELPISILAIFLIILNILTEYFMPVNYTIANFFTNPQVLLLMALSDRFVALNLIPSRIVGILLGSVLAMVLIFIMDYALRQLYFYHRDEHFPR